MPPFTADRRFDTVVTPWQTGTRPAGSPLRNRDFRAFLAARALASLSSLMLTVAVGWHVYALTGSAFALGMVGLAQFLPALLLALPGGLAADRIERRSILLAGICLQIVVALLLLSISLVPGARAGWIFPVVALIGVGQAFLGPASQSLVPFLVPREDFPRAVAWNSSTFQVATIAGPGRWRAPVRVRPDVRLRRVGGAATWSPRS